MAKQEQSTIINGYGIAKRISKRQRSRLIRRKLLKIGCKQKANALSYERIQDLLNESSVECSVCLQTLLKPVVAQCGHCFCLICTQILAKNEYSCGICHNHLPSHNVTFSRNNQELVNIYLSKCLEGEKRAYELRKKLFEEKQAERSIGIITVGSLVDFWCIQSKDWKSGAIRDISRDEIALISQEKGSKTFQVNILSRRLAKYRYFTKEKVTIQAVQRAPVHQIVPISQQKDEKRPTQPIKRLTQPEPQMFFNLFESQDQFGLEALESGQYRGFRYTF